MCCYHLDQNGQLPDITAGGNYSYMMSKFVVVLMHPDAKERYTMLCHNQLYYVIYLW